MRFDAKYFLRIFVLLLLCCAFFGATATPHASAYQNDHSAKISKVLNAENLPASPFIKFNLMGVNQEALRQVHRTNTTTFTAYLVPQSTNTCIRYFNYFSGYNDHRYTLRNADFLFPFHVFW